MTIIADFQKRGDKALSGQEEDVPSHRFPPDTRKRTINFRGKYLSIINKETGHQEIFRQDVKDSEDFEVPPGYTCYVRGAFVLFKD